MTKEITRRDVIRVGSVIFVSGAMGALQAVLTGCSATGNLSSSSSSSSSSSCVQSTNVTRGPYFVDNQSDPNINNDDVDASIPERSDIRSDTKGSTGTQSGLPLYLNIIVGSYSSGTCSPIANAQVHIWHCNAQGVYSDVQASTHGAEPPHVTGLVNLEKTCTAMICAPLATPENATPAPAPLPAAIPATCVPCQQTLSGQFTPAPGPVCWLEPFGHSVTLLPLTVLE